MSIEIMNRRIGEAEKRRQVYAAPSPILSKAFSLIELMVALTIIAILAAIVVVAYRGVIGGGKGNQTKATLSTLRGMLAEYENATHFQNTPGAWEWQVSGNQPKAGVQAYMVNNATFPPPNGADFWRAPSINISQLAPTGFADPMISPGLVVQDQPGQTPPQVDRTASVAVINTQIVMGMLNSLPVNQAIFAKMNASNTMYLPYWSSATNNSISVGGELSNGTRPTELIPGLPDNAAFDVLVPPVYGYGSQSNSGGASHQNVTVKNSGVNYVQGVEVFTTYAGQPQPAYFRNVGAGLNNQPLPPAPGQSTQNWEAVTNPTPIFLDAWGNPIIFVPGSGLLVWSKSQAVQDTSTKQWYVKPILIQSPDKKPFFASAGPDGDFSNGDDNLYSFEQ